MYRITDSSDYYIQLKKTQDEKIYSDIAGYVLSVCEKFHIKIITVILKTEKQKIAFLKFLNMLCINDFKISCIIFETEKKYTLEDDFTFEETSDNRILNSSDEMILDACSFTEYTEYMNVFSKKTIETVNSSSSLKVSLTVPCGINPDTGFCENDALHADFTVAAFSRIPAFVLSPGRFLCGNVEIVNEKTLNNDCFPGTGVFCISKQDVMNLLGKTDAGSNKGSNGRVMVICGSDIYPGAAVMCIGAAVTAGAGLTYAMIPDDLYKVVNQIPDAIYIRIPEIENSIINESSKNEILCQIKNKNAVCIGPGIAEIKSKDAVLQILGTEIPLVIDAGALNYLSTEKDLLAHLHRNVVLTPHPGELSRLIGVSADEITRNYIYYARKTAGDFGCTVILKGASSCISDGNRVCINITGDESLAKGGSGDVLSGILVAFLAKGMPAFTAAVCASYILGASAENAYAVLQKRALMHRDIIDCIKQTVEIS